MYARILVPLDGSVNAEQILPHAQTLGRLCSAQLILLHATDSEGSVAAADVDVHALVQKEQHEAVAYLDGVAEHLRNEGLEVAMDHPEGKPAARVIAEAARRHGADLIAMTTHGRSGLQRLLIGSVAEGVLREATCPVLLVRIQGPSH